MHVQGSKSDTSPVTPAVPQGSVLEPPLFLMFIINIPSQFKSSSVIRFFADDAIIYHQIRSADDGQILHEDLIFLLRWESDWDMTFHPQKCQTFRVI